MGLIEDAEEGRVEAVRARLAAGEAVNERREGETALLCAATAGHHEVVELLLKHGAAVNCVDEYGDRPIHRAVGYAPPASAPKKPEERYGYDRVVELLVEAKADLHRTDSEGNSLLHLAVQGRSLPVVKLLLKQGLTPTAIEEGMGYAALHEAAMIDLAEAIGVLVQGGASITLPSKRGDTPLHVACKSGSRAAIRALLLLGADDTIMNHAGQTPRDMAQTAGVFDIFELIADIKREEEMKAAAEQEQAQEELKKTRESALIIDPRARQSLVALCWACSVTERDPGKLALMKGCAACKGKFHVACVEAQESDNSISYGGKWRCPMCVSASKFENKDGFSLIPEEMGPYVRPDGDPPKWPRNIPYQHVQYALDQAAAWGRVAVFLDTKGDSDVDNFFQYSKVQMIEARWCYHMLHIEKSKTMDEIREHLRKKLVAAMKNGAVLWIRMGSTAVRFKGSDGLCHPKFFPETVFNPIKFRDPKEFLKVVKDSDTEDTQGVFVLRKGFAVMITSSFTQQAADMSLDGAFPRYDEMAVCDVIPGSIVSDGSGSYEVPTDENEEEEHAEQLGKKKGKDMLQLSLEFQELMITYDQEEEDEKLRCCNHRIAVPGFGCGRRSPPRPKGNF